MKTLNITCTQCGTQINVNSELNKCMCPNCGAEMSIRKTAETQKDTAFINGYKAELGRQKALYEINQQKQAEAIALQEEQKKKWVIARVGQIIGFLCAFVYAMQSDSFEMIVVFIVVGLINLIIDMVIMLNHGEIAGLGTAALMFILPVLSVPYYSFKTKNFFCAIIHGACLGGILGCVIHLIKG